MIRFNFAPCLLAAAITALAVPTWGVPFSTGYTDGATWNFLYAQGFSPAVRANPDPFSNPGLGVDDIVPLDRFRFFKSGYLIPDTTNPLVAENFQLAIVNNFFLDLSTFTVNSPELVGLSTNTIGTTTAYETGAAIDFNFDSLALSYGAIDYAAIFVRRTGDNLAIVPVPVLIADYVETAPGSGVYAPESDYGDPNTDFLYSASNFFTGNFLNSFNAPYADGNFVAYFDLPAGVPGDFNDDDRVDAADYTTWRDNLGAAIALPNEDATLNSVTQEDYTTWVTNFGMSAGASAGGNLVPEPSACVLCGLAIFGLWRRRK